MKTKTILVFLFFLSTVVQSQVNYKPGYIVLTNGDTLITKIKYLPGNKMCKKIYYLDSLGVEEKMPMNFVVLYKRADVVYRKFPISQASQRFYKQIDTGHINVYFYSSTKTHTNQISASSTHGSNIKTSMTYSSTRTSSKLFFVLEKDSIFSIPIKNETNLESIKAFVCDDPEICYKLISFKNISELPALINEYNKRHPIENKL